MGRKDGGKERQKKGEREGGGDRGGEREREKGIPEQSQLVVRKGCFPASKIEKILRLSRP